MSNEQQLRFTTSLLELLIRHLHQIEQLLGLPALEQVGRGSASVLAWIVQRFANIVAELERRNRERDIEAASARQRAEPQADQRNREGDIEAASARRRVEPEPQAGGSREGAFRPEVYEFGQLMTRMNDLRGDWHPLNMGITEERYQALQEDSSSLRDFVRAVLLEWYGNLAAVNLGRVGRPGTIVMSHERRHQLYRLAATYCNESGEHTSFPDLANMLAHMLANAKRGPTKSRSPEPKRRRSEKDNGEASSDSNSSGDDDGGNDDDGANSDDGSNDDDGANSDDGNKDDDGANSDDGSNDDSD